MENMDIDIVETSKQSDSPEEQELNNHDQDTDSDILDSDNGSDNNSRLSSPLSTSTAKLVKSPPPSVVPPTVSHRHSIPLNIDFANLSAISNGTAAASNAFNGGISSDPASELFFNYQLARNAASFSPFAFPNSPIFLPPSLLKPANYIQQGNNPLRPLNLSLGTVSNPSDIVSAAAAAAAISLANSHSSNGLLTNSLGHQSSSKLSQSIMVSSSNQSNNGPNSSKLQQQQQQQQTNSSKRLSPNLLCVVCGDLSSGKHYGILACNGCSGFFKRSVRRKLIYRCQAGTGSCIIDKQHRNQCQACRLKKCISMGMNKDAVQNERQPRNTATIRPEVLMSDCNSERLLREGVAATVAAVFGLSSSLRRDNSLKQFTSYSHHHGHGNSDNSATTKATFKEATSPNGKKFDLKALNNNNNGRECNDSASALFNPNLCYSNSLSLDYSQLSDISNSLLLLNQDSFYEISARILFMGVKWIKNLPSFVNLSFRDQTILLEESWTEIFILSAIQWSLPLEKCSIFSAANIPNGTDYSLDIRVLNDTFERFRQIAPNAGEFACLKALALFKPEARGLKEVSKIEQMQDQTQLMLLQQVKNQNSSNPIRYGKLLLLLLSLKIIPSDKIATIYFKKAIGNTTIEKLLREMFKC